MKRLLCLIIALFLPLTALAEELRARIAAPEHITDTLLSNTGATEIVIDADILVPDVSAVPLWEVTGTCFPAEKVFEVARLLSPEAVVEQMLDFSYVDDGKDILPELVQGDYSVTRLPSIRVEAGDLSFSSAYVQGRKLKGSAGYWLDERQQVYFNVFLEITNNRFGVTHVYGRAVDIPGGDIPGNALTRANAIAVADAFVAAIAPGFECHSVGSITGFTLTGDHVINGYDGDQNIAAVPARVADGYQLAYTRTLEGMPVTWAVNWLNHRETFDSFGFPPGYERLYITLDDLGEVASVYWEAPYTIGRKVAEDCELLPFEQIWNNFRGIAPLSIMYQESEGDVHASVDRIELGYMPVRQPDGGYLLSPVWDFFGESMYKGVQRDYQGNSILTIDAITGFVIDRSYGY